MATHLRSARNNRATRRPRGPRPGAGGPGPAGWLDEPFRVVGSRSQAAPVAGLDNQWPHHPTTRPLRQATLWHMQQQVGNAAVQRQLQGQRTQPPAHSAADVVQREITARQQAGIGVVLGLCRDINNAGREFGIPPELIGVIVMHESQAGERAIFVLDALADAAERAQAAMQGESASIGVGQMRVGTARQLRQRYPALRVAESVVDDLLDRRRAVRYVAAQLREIKRQLDAFMAGERVSLSQEAELDMLAVAYNIGWPNLRDRNLRDRSLGAGVLQRVAAIRARSTYLRHTTTQLALMRLILMRAGIVH